MTQSTSSYTERACRGAAEQLSRGDFLRFLGLGTAAALIGGSCRGSEKIAGIAPGAADRLALAGGLQSRVLLREGDVIHKQKAFRVGANNDYLAFFADPADRSRATLWINHESPGLLDAAGDSTEVYRLPRNRTDFNTGRGMVGGSRVGLRRDSSGQWQADLADPLNFRIDGTTPIALSMPLGGRRVAEGTLGNCAGGQTPWGTLLTCEENHLYFYGDSRWNNGAPENFLFPKPDRRHNWQRFQANSPDDYGWVVEVDLKTGKATKQIALGRCFHECATVAPARDYAQSGRVAVYSGDDVQGGCIYKFISDQPNSLASGTLYAADTDQGRWVELSLNNPALKEFGTLENILVHARDAAIMAGATPQDRPEDIELSPHVDGAVFLTLTNNTKKAEPNYYGSILKIQEANGDPLALKFESETFLPGGPGHGHGAPFASPDNLAFDPQGNLWMASDISESAIEQGPYAGFGNNGLFVIPMRGAQAGQVVQVGHAPVDAELTGITFAPDGRTLLLSVQHPGLRTKDRREPTSRWPDGEQPLSAVVAITGELLERLSAI